MSSSVFLGGSVVAATIAGMIALFAPCCVSVMLPSFFAASFQNRRMLVAMTFVFGAGVATVILPLALGASALRRLIIGQHTTVYAVGGLALLGLGIFLLAGGKIRLPMPGRRAGTAAGPASVYGLGLFSGVASSCCAPVLAGVIALSGVASSFAVSLGLGLAYVFGMVAPLFVIAVAWDRHETRLRGLFRPHTFTWHSGPLRRTVSGTNLASGLLMLVMGVVTLWIGLNDDGMRASRGWQASLSAELAHYGNVLTGWLDWIPGWVVAVALLISVAWLARRAARQVGWIGTPTSDPHGPPADPEGATVERDRV